VRHTNGGPTYLGELDESRTSRLGHITALFAAGGLNTVVVPNIITTIWEKFVYNCGINAITALTGLRQVNLEIFTVILVNSSGGHRGLNGSGLREMNS
jgi:2-dehydropantoate 2-reductase